MSTYPALAAALRWLSRDARAVWLAIRNGEEPSLTASDALVADMRLIAEALAQPETVGHCPCCIGNDMQTCSPCCPGLPVAGGGGDEEWARKLEIQEQQTRDREEDVLRLGADRDALRAEVARLRAVVGAGGNGR
jgi:hypothetical protein